MHSTVVFSLLILTLFLTLHITNTDVKTISTQLTASSQGSLYCLLYTEAMLLQEAKSSQICTFYFLRLTLAFLQEVQSRNRFFFFFFTDSVILEHSDCSPKTPGLSRPSEYCIFSQLSCRSFEGASTSTLSSVEISYFISYIGADSFSTYFISYIGADSSSPSDCY